MATDTDFMDALEVEAIEALGETAAAGGLIASRVKGASKAAEAAGVAPPEHFARCHRRLEAAPTWVEVLQRRIDGIASKVGGGDVYVVATDPVGDLVLEGFVVAGGGAHVYQFACERPIGEDAAWWAFAARNFYWLTPTVELRKRVGEALGVGDKDMKGSCVKAAAHAVRVDEFLAIAAPCPTDTPAQGQTAALF